MVNRSRKKQILLEIMSEKEFLGKNIFLPSNFNTDSSAINHYDSNYMLQDRFSVKMETETFVVNPERIKGFKIEKSSDKRIIKIKSYLQVHEWIKDFEKVHIIKIFFFDSRGNILKNSFDYDVDFFGFNLECDYSYRDYLTPVFIYEILSRD